MERIAIINLGSHDISIKEGKQKEIAELFSDLENIDKVTSDRNWVQCNFYNFTKRLCEEYPKGLDCVEFPIVKPILATINKECGNKVEEAVEKIIFITTKQKRIESKDTIYLGKLFELIKKDTKSVLAKELKLDNLKIGLMSLGENPADYDLMMSEYKNIMNKNAFANKIFISITGGTPAMNMALLYNSINMESAKVIPLYTNIKNRKCEKIRLSEDLRKDKIIKELNLFINKQSYEAAETVLEKNRVLFEEKRVKVILNMLKIAKDRREFNFKDTLDLIEEIKYEDPRSRSICDEFHEVINNLLQPKDTYLLNEVKNNAIYKYNNGSYTDFLGRVFRIQEEVYKLILKKHNLIKVVKHKEREEEQLNEEQLTNDQLEKLDKYNDGKLRYKNCELNIFVMSAIIEVVIDNNSLEKRIYNECESKLTKLKNIRNKSILAHGYEGASYTLIRESIPNAEEFLNALVNDVNSLIGTKVEDDNFYSSTGEYNRYLIKLIEEL